VVVRSIYFIIAFVSKTPSEKCHLFYIALSEHFCAKLLNFVNFIDCCALSLGQFYHKLINVYTVIRVGTSLWSPLLETSRIRAPKNAHLFHRWKGVGHGLKPQTGPYFVSISLTLVLFIILVRNVSKVLSQNLIIQGEPVERTIKKSESIHGQDVSEYYKSSLHVFHSINLAKCVSLCFPLSDYMPSPHITALLR